MIENHALSGRVFGSCGKGFATPSKSLKFAIYGKITLRTCAKAEKRNFADFEALDREKFTTLLGDSRKRFFSFLGKMHASAFLQTRNRKRELRLKYRAMGWVVQDRDSSHNVYVFLLSPRHFGVPATP